jgi:DNA-binding response OmpR family regulator
MSFRILVVDDEKEIRDLIARYLSRELFEVDTAPDGRTALSYAEENEYHLMVLDVMMPGMDGFELLTALRDRDIETPILFLTARRSDGDVIQGLGMGADEYMTKPFSPAVLTARVKALLRLHFRMRTGDDTAGDLPGHCRDSPTSQNRLQLGEFLLDRDKCQVFKHGSPLQLTAMEYRLLTFFLEHPDQVFTRSQLYEHCWDETYYDDNTVVVYIRRLREKIEDDPSFPQRLITMRGLGYYFTTGEKG